jgi:catechol 2,3-dioxygenase-like lactoylglutathione lyase family enzyme
MTSAVAAHGIHHLKLTVSDVDRSLDFYRDLLGFEVVMTQEKQGGYLAAIDLLHGRWSAQDLETSV